MPSDQRRLLARAGMVCRKACAERVAGGVRRICRDVRGANLLEYILLLGCVAVLCLAAWRFFGQSVRSQIECEAHTISLLDPSDLSSCSEGAGGGGASGAPQAGPAIDPSGGAAGGVPSAGVFNSGVPAGSGAASGPGAGASAGAAPSAGPGTSGAGASGSTPGPRPGASGSAGASASSGAGTSPAPAGSAGGPSEAAQLANALCVTAGTATAADRAAVMREVEKIPVDGLKAMQAAGIKITVVRGSVVEALPALSGVKPRGWPPGSSWDTVPGLYDANTKQVIIATRGGAVPATGDGHGSVNPVIHETAHAIDAATGGHNDPAFQAARNRDIGKLPAYETQAGNAGLEESYAEGMARYYGNPSSSQSTSPALYQYWGTNPLHKP